MPPRLDITDNLIHFTSANSDDVAYQRLREIVGGRVLIGSGSKIKGGFSCVCFSEAPLKALSAGLVNDRGSSRYRPFGIIFDKAWIFAQGGRPVIYQTDEEYGLLPQELRWRHMRYEPIAAEPIDFTWEREWRINTDGLLFDPSVAGVVVPNADWAARFEANFNEEQEIKIQEYAQIFDELLAHAFQEDYPWRVYKLR